MKPLGSSDYLMLARSFHTIIIREIPQITSRLPSGRRFITLIDNLYDSKTRVSCTTYSIFFIYYIYFQNYILHFQLVLSSDVSVSELFMPETNNDQINDSHRMLMDDLGISKNSVNILSNGIQYFSTIF